MRTLLATTGCRTRYGPLPVVTATLPHEVLPSAFLQRASAHLTCHAGMVQPQMVDLQEPTADGKAAAAKKACEERAKAAAAASAVL